MSGSFYSEEEEEGSFETEYTDESVTVTKPPSAKSGSAIASPGVKGTTASTPDVEEEDSSSQSNVRTAKFPPVNVRAEPAQKAPPQKLAAVHESEEDEMESEDEFESESQSEAAPAKVSARPPVAVAATGAPGSARTLGTPQSARSGTYGSSYEEEESYEDESQSESVDSSGILWELVSSALCKPAFVTLVQRMFSGDSGAKSLVARDVVAVTTPTRHCLVVLRNAVRAEFTMREPFNGSGSFYQDVLFHTLVRSGASFFRQALSPTVKALSVVAVDYDLSAANVGAAKVEQHQAELKRLGSQLFDDIFSDSAKAAVPRLLRCALSVACEEVKLGGNKDASNVSSFLAIQIVARLLADPTGSKMTPSVSRIALANLGRLSKLATLLFVADPALTPYFGAWASQQAARLGKWVSDMCVDPTGTSWKAELQPQPGLPQKERDLAGRFSSEISTLKQWLTTGQKERSGGLTAEEKPVLEHCLSLLRPLAAGISGSSTDPIRSVRNPHRRVPHELPQLQQEIVGLESVTLASVGRKLVSQGPVVARKKNCEEDGHLFLFSDILLYCKHNPQDHAQLFTFSRAYRLHQVVVRMLPEGERASAAAFSVSAFAMPAHHDLTFFAANAHDKERWVELIRKKQVELRLVLLKASKKFLVDEVVKNGRKIPVELAIANEVMMKVVPDTDDFIASYDFAQLSEWKMDGNDLVLDFNGQMEGQKQEDLVLRVRGERCRNVAEEVSKVKAAAESAPLSARGALPSFRRKDQTPLKQKSANASVSNNTVNTVNTVSSSVSQPAPPLPVAERNPLTAPPSMFAGAGKRANDGNQVIDARAFDDSGKAALPLAGPNGTQRDGWVAVDLQAEAREKSEARLRRQREKEQRQRKRDKAKEGRNVRLDEDKAVFSEALERSLAHLVTPVDESSLRRPEELTDAEILGLQKRAYRWKRENRLLKELLYTQYVIAQKK